MSRLLPGLGLEAFWPLGFNGWNGGMDTNLRVISALLQGRVLDFLPVEPSSPTDGDIVILDETNATNPNAIAIRDNGAWVYVTPLSGWKMYDVTAGADRRFNATTWGLEPVVDDDPTLSSGSTTNPPSVNAAKQYVDSAVAAVSGSGGSVPDGIVSGCGVVYSGTGLTFNMSAGSFYIDGDLHTAAAQSITLAAADATNPRIDVLFVDDTGTFGKITGTPAASPSQPSIDPTTQLYLTFVLVPAAATSLSGITNETIYDEGTEWTGSTSGTGFTVGSTNNPYSGTKDIEGTSVASGAYAKFVRASSMSFDGDGNLTFRIRSKATWNSRRWLVFQWYSGGIAKGSPVNLKSGTFGFDSSSTSAYQLIVIPKTQFAVPAGTNVDELRITDAGGSIGFYIDAIILQNVGGSAGSGGTTSGITQDQADARYVKKSGDVMSGDLIVPGEAYGAGWNGSNEVPTKNDVYDKIEGVIAGTATVDNDTALASDSTTNPPSVHAVRGYVDAKVAGLSWKQAVRAATTSAHTLATDYENGDIIDGVTLATGDRVLIKNQATASENGIYTVNASGAPTRATDADSGAELVNASVYVSEGTTNADTQWTCTTNATITPGSTSLTFAQLTSGGGGLLAANNLSDVADPATAGANIRPVESLIVACSDETTALTTGTAKITFRMPYAFTVTAVRASLTTAQASGSIFTVDINESGTSIISTKLTIDNTEKTSTTAATAAVISDSSLADDAEMTVDIDQIGDGTAKGLKIYLIGHRT